MARRKVKTEVQIPPEFKIDESRLTFRWSLPIIGYLDRLLKNKKLSTELEYEISQYILSNSDCKADAPDEQLQYRYLEKVKTLSLNLNPNSHIGNKTLLPNFISGKITPKQLVYMSSIEQFPENWQDIIDQQNAEQYFLYNTKRVSNTTNYTCPECKKKNIHYHELQTRAADEPATIFCECLDCGKRWRGG